LHDLQPWEAIVLPGNRQMPCPREHGILYLPVHGSWLFLHSFHGRLLLFRSSIPLRLSTTS